jgi:hypothetical protein
MHSLDIVYSSSLDIAVTSFQTAYNIWSRNYGLWIQQHLAGTEEEGKIFSMFAINMFITLLAFSVTFLARAYIYSTGFNLGYRLE